MFEHHVHAVPMVAEREFGSLGTRIWMVVTHNMGACN